MGYLQMGDAFKAAGVLARRRCDTATSSSGLFLNLGINTSVYASSDIRMASNFNNAHREEKRGHSKDDFSKVVGSAILAFGVSFPVHERIMVNMGPDLNVQFTDLYSGESMTGYMLTNEIKLKVFARLFK